MCFEIGDGPVAEAGGCLVFKDRLVQHMTGDEISRERSVSSIWLHC